MSVEERKKRRRPRHELKPDAKPTNQQLHAAMLDRHKKARDEARRRATLLPFMLPEEQRRASLCRGAVSRYADEAAGRDFLRSWRCKVDAWCPTCARISHYARTQRVLAKLASLDPGEEPKATIAHLVFTLPPPLLDLARRDPRARRAFQDAIRETIAGAYGYKGKHAADAAKVAFQEMGLRVNWHALGSKGTPFPKWALHADCLLLGHRARHGKLLPLPTHWPEFYLRTAARYRRALRDAFLPLVTRPYRNVELEAFLQSYFDVDWHVTEERRGSRRVLLTKGAPRIVSYSVRPLYDASLATVQHDADGRAQLVYRPPVSRKERVITHRVPAAPAFAALRDMREWLWGKGSFASMGILSDKTYAKTVRLIPGREPVMEKPAKGVRLKAIYHKSPAGGFTTTPARDAWRGHS